MKEKRTGYSIPLMLFLFILVFAPSAFGTVELWSQIVLYVSISLLSIFLYLDHRKKDAPFIKVPGVLPIVLFVVWMIAQVIPLPLFFVKIISPQTFAVYQPVLSELNESRWIPLSINTKNTIYETVRISSYALFYVLTIQLLSSGKRLKRTVEIVAGCAVLIALIAILQKLTLPDYFYWFRLAPEGSKNFGPWVNRSQYSGFMLMILPLLLALFLYYRPRFSEDDSFRVKVASLFTAAGSHRQILAAFGGIVVFLSVLLSMSRGGILVAIVCLCLFFIILSRVKKYNYWGVLLILLCTVFLFFYTFGAEQIAARFNMSFSQDGELNIHRVGIWSDSLEIIKDFWITGSGFGTFVDIYPLYKTIPDSLIYDHAHNDYLEILCDGGIIGFILATWFVFVVIRTSWRKIRIRKDNYAILLSLGGLVGILSMLLYSITDFNMHNGADGLYFFFLCGLSISAANTRFQYYREATLLQSANSKKRIWVLAASLFLLLAVFLFPVRGFIAREIYREVEKVYISRQLSEQKMAALTAMLKKSSSYDPLEGVYLMALGNIQSYLKKSETALSYHLEAAFRNPMRGEFLQKIGLLLPDSSKERSTAFMELSYKRSLKKDELLLNFAEWLLLQGERQRSIAVLKNGFAGNPKLLDDAVLLLENHFSQQEVANILPPKVSVWIHYGKYLEGIGEVKQSEYFRKGALDFIDNEKSIKAHWYSQLYYYYSKRKREDDAVAVLRSAVIKVSDNVEFHIHLGDYYKKQGIPYRAREEYEQALIFDPGNETIISRLESLGQQ